MVARLALAAASRFCVTTALWIATFLLLPAALIAAEATPTPTEGATEETPAQRGYRLLTTKAYLPADFDQDIFDELWKVWEEPARTIAGKSTPAERRKMAFSRYGLTEAPEGDRATAMQYVDDGKKGWVMNCMACHGGKVEGRAIPGLPNSHYAMQTLADEVRSVKLKQGKLSPLEVAAAAFPMGGSNGTTNAVMFGVALGYLRDEDLNVRIPQGPPPFVHHDMDAPPWWNVKKKTYLYMDGFSPKSHRALMQFLMIPQNGPENFRKWEADFKDIYAWIESLEAAKISAYAIDQDLAAKGHKIFDQSCSRCHGTYGEKWTYPNKMVPIDEVGTDRVRLDALTVPQRMGYERNWFNSYGEKKVVGDPDGYIAPPLDGVWASAPYLHNGSVPTLWHLFHASERPVVWQRTEDGYDQQKVGLEVTTMQDLPADVKRRQAEASLFRHSPVWQVVRRASFPGRARRGGKTSRHRVS